MVKTVFILALLSAISLVFAAEIKEESLKDYIPPPCPCRCFTKHRIYLAEKQCKRRQFLYRCQVLDCVPKKYYLYPSGYKGKECCDYVYPIPTATATATPTPTPSPKKKPVCPCKCTSLRRAVRQCKYYPYCKVLKCIREKRYGYRYGYRYRYRKRFECCDYH